MIVEHDGYIPCVDSTAVIDAHATIIGNVTIGAHTVVLAGSIITSEGAEVHIGERCVIMEHALIRGAGIHPCIIADHVLVGPHSSVSGAVIKAGCFIATGAAVFNGSLLEEGTTVAVHGIVHIETYCPPSTFVPMQYIAFGNPAVIYSPEQAPTVHKELFSTGLTHIVFGFDSSHMTNADATRAICEKYTQALQSHQNDK